MDAHLLTKCLLTYNAHVVRKEGCWSWKGSKTPKGYGKVTVILAGKPKTVSAHKIAYEHYVGTVPEGLLLMHSCDNPAHLSIGTNKDNSQDCLNKGRRPSVECISNAKLTAEQVRSIWTQRNNKSAKQLSKEFEVAYYTVIDILGRRTWKHITNHCV